MFLIVNENVVKMEMTGIEPVTSHMRSERSTTELHPHEQPRRIIQFWSKLNSVSTSEVDCAR